MTRIRSTLVLLTVVCGLYACAGNPTWLNSDRIERAFGSYGVDVLEDDGGRRVSSLYSTERGEKTTRTYAVVDFIDGTTEAYASEHRQILSGGSIGSTFRDAGWAISKQHLFIGELEVPESYTAFGELMRIALPATLATHHYLFVVSRDQKSWNYATITEIHHPEFLSASDLREIYGEILFDDSNRDSIHDFIGPPLPK